MIEKYTNVPRRRLLAVPLAALLTACAATTVEGVTTQQCLDGIAEYTLRPGDKIYLGDLSSSESMGDGRHDDWMALENRDGAIITDSEDNGALDSDAVADDGAIQSAEGGFIYEENDNEYIVTYRNGNDINAAVRVTIESNCESE